MIGYVTTSKREREGERGKRKKREDVCSCVYVLALKK
jgi:hypothetical protein